MLDNSSDEGDFVRRHVRGTTIGATVAGLAAVLVLTGCGSDDGDKGDEGGDKGAASDSASKGPGSGGSGESDAKGGSLEGSWMTQSKGKPVALVIRGGNASLASAGQVCSGTAKEESGTRMIRLKCSDGSADRSEGRVESVDGTKLKVAWEGFGTDEFSKAEGGRLPKGLPTADLPQG
ncbi:hypothetical protein GCM10018785_03630 [Streptomyces longispororuber]|uniref:Uncharacterized protein n=1 Tax=Streptomyces longispororuber TaxID=68230 RepID=A0A919DCL2_9ACTN|nr:hypothetical protein [Streptomyces longispororuber]GHE37208.1 hypothetical protein GCM10018785_03630 [Streptomyces longispororuber]